MNIGCIVLAGGAGFRLGRDKRLETVGSVSLLERVLSQISFLNSEIVLVAASCFPHSHISGYPGLRVVSDIYPGSGPLGGIYTGLKAARSFYNLVVACDMPFLNRDLIRYMMAISGGSDVVIPRIGEYLEPLHAVYSKACIAPAESLLTQGQLRVGGILNRLKVRYVDADEINCFDPGHLSFFNINTKSDLAKARGLLKEQA